MNETPFCAKFKKKKKMDNEYNSESKARPIPSRTSYGVSFAETDFPGFELEHSSIQQSIGSELFTAIDHMEESRTSHLQSLVSSPALYSRSSISNGLEGLKQPTNIDDSSSSSNREHSFSFTKAFSSASSHASQLAVQHKQSPFGSPFTQDLVSQTDSHDDNAFVSPQRRLHSFSQSFQPIGRRVSEFASPMQDGALQATSYTPPPALAVTPPSSPLLRRSSSSSLSRELFGRRHGRNPSITGTPLFPQDSDVVCETIVEDAVVPSSPTKRRPSVAQRDDASATSTADSPSMKDTKKASLYKTELCRSWEETGTCRYGDKCQFAHSRDELRVVDRHPKYKTEMCKTFWEKGSCPYGKRCCFIHTANNNKEETQKQRGRSIDGRMPQSRSPSAGYSRKNSLANPQTYASMDRLSESFNQMQFGSLPNGQYPPLSSSFSTSNFSGSMHPSLKRKSSSSRQPVGDQLFFVDASAASVNSKYSNYNRNLNTYEE